MSNLWGISSWNYKKLALIVTTIFFFFLNRKKLAILDIPYGWILVTHVRSPLNKWDIGLKWSAKEFFTGSGPIITIRHLATIKTHDISRSNIRRHPYRLCFICWDIYNPKGLTFHKTDKWCTLSDNLNAKQFFFPNGDQLDLSCPIMFAANCTKHPRWNHCDYLSVYFHLANASWTGGFLLWSMGSSGHTKN